MKSLEVLKKKKEKITSKLFQKQFLSTVNALPASWNEILVLMDAEAGNLAKFFT